jgi:formimidoylglutamate deiminase
MAVIFAGQALLENGWANNVRIDTADGLISAISPNSRMSKGAVSVDTLLPAPGNLHSHSFQRFMAGMTEFRSSHQDSFWTWRDLMYRFVDRLTPDHIEAVAGLVFMEMLEAGYASVGEFHYVHHRKGGGLYDNRGELSYRIFAAAQATGIGLTHLPVLYTYGGAGKKELTNGQLRFGNSVDDFLKMLSGINTQFSRLPPDWKLGIAPHSLRATSPEELEAVLAGNANYPIHIHIAEQVKEVQDIKNWLGTTPVEWLTNHVDVDANWCLIHATHMTEGETIKLAKSGATAGLCPITEANLGDGIFDGAHYLQGGGAFGIGSDSNVQIALGGELRSLEYSQRLQNRARNLMAAGKGSVGHTLYTGAAFGGAKALGRNAGLISIGKLADLVAIDTTSPQLCALAQNQLLDGLVFAAKDDVVTDVWSAGRHVVSHGHHINREAIIAEYKIAVRSLIEEI